MRQPPSNFNSLLHEGIDDIRVSLIVPVQAMNAAYSVAKFFESTWGAVDDWDDEGFWLTAQNIAAGEGLPNALESVSLTFAFEGVSRATTHQLVRTRVGAGFGQQGGRDNNWSNFNFRKPRSFREATGPSSWHEKLHRILSELDGMYKEAIEMGIPYQDARYILPMGLETALVGTYNLLSLKGTLKRRLCNRMMWETNYVARLMHDLTVKALPWVGKSLRSSCEDRGVCGSVSPMFPPACYKNGQLVSDNPILKKMMADGDYDWPETSNGNYIHFDSIDSHRTSSEPSDEVWSLVTGEVIAGMNREGEWLRV